MTTQAKHTPGPWAANDDGLVLGNLDNYEGEAPLVCTCGSADDFNMEPDLHLANARLIAAAPDLLDALETIAAGNTDPDRMVEIAREAIARTEGAQ
jgi:hypothetical protein